MEGGREPLPLLLAHKVLLPGVEINMSVAPQGVALVEDCLRGAIPGNEICELALRRPQLPTPCLLRCESHFDSACGWFPSPQLTAHA